MFLDESILPDNKLINIALDDACYFGMLSSRVHIAWTLGQGSVLGPTPVYVKTRCFETFPFPDTPPELATRIADLAERIDHHRKRQLAEHPKLTLTGMYNVLEQLRAGEALSAKDQTLHEQGLVSLLREWHDELDRAVFAAYGWEDLADALVGRPGATTPLLDKPAEQSEAEEELLCRLVALNQQRAAEERQGRIRWLRPEYQAPDAVQTGSELTATTPTPTVTPVVAAASQVWPKTPREQVELMRDLLATPQTLDQLAAQFKRKPTKAIQQQLDALVAMGLVTESNEQPGVWQWG
jgi:hypothetical protein